MQTFVHRLNESLNFDLESETTENGRFYTVPNGQRYASITTILSQYNKEGIHEWVNRVGEEEANRIKRIAADRGTKLHDACEKYLKNELTQMERVCMFPDVKGLFNTISKALDKYINVVHALEQPLYSNILRIAGRVDCIAEWNGKLSIIDFKTSEKLKKEEWIRNYFMQCSGYAEMHEELTGISIDNIVVLITTPESSEPQIFERNKNDYIDDLRECVTNYYK